MKIVLTVRIFFLKMYGFFQKKVRILRFFFENCTDCTDIFRKLYGLYRFFSENVRIFSKKFWPSCMFFLGGRGGADFALRGEIQGGQNFFEKIRTFSNPYNPYNFRKKSVHFLKNPYNFRKLKNLNST